MLAETNVADIVVALIGGGGAVLVVIAPVAFDARRRTKRAEEHAAATREAVGPANGRGSTNVMLERVLENQAADARWQRDHERRDEDRFNGIHAHYRATTDRLAAIERQLGMET